MLLLMIVVARTTQQADTGPLPITAAALKRGGKSTASLDRRRSIPITDVRRTQMLSWFVPKQKTFFL